jgi:hypothetical protein
MVPANETEAVFEPRYERKYWFSLLFVPLMSAAAMWFGFSERNLILFMSGLFFVVILLWTPTRLVRRARFGRKLVIERFFFPPREIDYNDIVDVGNAAVKTKGRFHISLNAMTNADEFKDMLFVALAQADVPDGQLEGKLVRQEANVALAAMYAAGVSLVLHILVVVILMWIKPPWLGALNREVSGVIYVALFGICYLVFYQMRKLRAPEPQA